MIILLFLIIFSSHIYSAGFAENTLLLTNCDQITFDKLDCNALIQSHENHFQPILFLSKQSVEEIVHICLTDECIVCHKKQLFWCVNKNDWICAEDLTVQNLLYTIDGQHIAIDAVQKIQQQTEIYSLSVGPPHHLYVGNHAILAHNFAWFVGIGVELAFGCGAVEFIKGSFIVALGFVVLKIQDNFAKNKDKKKPKVTVSVQPERNGSGNFNPNDDDKKDKDKKKNLIYKGSEAHKSYQSGKKGKEPTNGQEALNNSFLVKNSSDRRVSICENEFVVLDITSDGIYHGHVRTWKELGSKMQNVLKKQGLVNRHGKIL